jgi:hypothetical protein
MQEDHYCAQQNHSDKIRLVYLLKSHLACRVAPYLVLRCTQPSSAHMLGDPACGESHACWHVKPLIISSLRLQA